MRVEHQRRWRRTSPTRPTSAFSRSPGCGCFAGAESKKPGIGRSQDSSDFCRGELEGGAVGDEVRLGQEEAGPIGGKETRSDGGAHIPASSRTLTGDLRESPPKGCPDLVKLDQESCLDRGDDQKRFRFWNGSRPWRRADSGESLQRPRAGIKVSQAAAPHGIVVTYAEYPDNRNGSATLQNALGG